jgi:hypothetical protein
VIQRPAFIGRILTPSAMFPAIEPRHTRRSAMLLVSTLMLAAGCAAATISMVDMQSESREICPPAPGVRKRTVTGPQMHELTELQEEAARTGMSALELCARELEILGYRREGQAEYRRYVSPVYKWSISYPPGWTLDDEDPTDVRIQSPASLPRGLVGIHSEIGVAVSSGGEYANIFLDRWNRNMARQGVSAVLTSRRARILDGTFVALIEHLMGARQPRGKSRKVIGLIGEQGFIIDAETFEKSWTLLEPYFYQIIRSFTFPR